MNVFIAVLFCVTNYKIKMNLVNRVNKQVKLGLRSMK